ncbi:MAG: aromatic-ring-hydroxylating dioxygenase subunit beta [Chromatiales bacterium]|jgi:anthranilate 1,2-dioxygenase small subunit|nr:aromatic-ring-hydroxylating dioxygenase subunit beta [Chromatiales bacterium]
MNDAVQPVILDGQLRASIDEFLADYAHTIDDGEVQRWPGFFHAEGRYQIITREGYEAGWPIGIMACDSRAMMEDRMLALETANVFEPHTYCHVLSYASLRKEAGGVIRARSNLSVVRTMQDGRMETFAVGKYVDEISIDGDGHPKFLSRTVVLDARRVDILLVYPL